MSASAGASRIEIYCFIGNHLNAEGGSSFMKLPRRSGCLESGYFQRRVSALPVRPFAPGTSKLLLKLLTIRRSQIKIRAFFVEMEMRESSGIVRIYCQLNATVSQKKRGNNIADCNLYLRKVHVCMPKYHKHVY